MKIRIDSLRPIRIARLADAEVDHVVFDISPWREAYPALTNYRVEVTSPGGIVYFPAKLVLDGNDFVWTITAEDTASAGDGLYQIVAAGTGGEHKTSAFAAFTVRATMPGTAEDTPPDPAKPWVDKVVEAAQRVEDATVHPPIIGTNGNWLLWDFETAVYVDSGKPSQGSGSSGGGNAQETDPTVPAWAKQPNPPTYTAQDVGARPADWLPALNEIGAQPAGNYALKSEIPAVPVQSVNGKAGAVELTAEDVGAASKESVDRLNEEIVEQGKAIEGKADKLNTPVHIDTITIKENVTKFVVETEPDGTPYNFKKIVVRITTPPHDSIGNWNLYPFKYSKLYDRSVTIPGFPDKTQEYYGEFVCDISDGFANMYAYKGKYSTVFNAMQTTPHALCNQNLSKVDLRASLGIPVDTIIEIEAVRA